MDICKEPAETPSDWCICVKYAKSVDVNVSFLICNDPNFSYSAVIYVMFVLNAAALTRALQIDYV